MERRGWRRGLQTLEQGFERGLLAMLGVVMRRPRTVLLVCLALSLLSLLAAQRIVVRTSFWDTMSEQEPSIARIRYLASNFPSAITVQVAVEGNEPGRLIEVGEQLREALLRDRKLVRNVYLEQPIDFFQRRALLYLPADELRLLDGELARHSAELEALAVDPSVLGLMRALDTMGGQMFPAASSMTTLSTRVFAAPLMEQILAGRPAAQLGLKVDTSPLQRRVEESTLQAMRQVPVPPSDPVAQGLLGSTRDMLDLVADVLEQGERLSPEQFRQRCSQLREFGADSLGGLPPRYRFNDARDMLLLEVAAVEDVTRIEHVKPFIAHLEQALDEVRAAARDVKISATGMPVLYAQDEKAVLDNFALVTLLGLLGILAVFIIGFEQVGLPSLSLLPLIMGVLWTLGLQGLLRPELNMFNLLFPVLLFGLGIDFAIHLISGFTQTRSQGVSAEESLRETFRTVVPGLLVGALTTAAAFYVLTLASLKGVRELGLTAGTGVAMSLLAMLLAMPAMLLLWDARRVRKGQAVPHIEFVAIRHLGTRLRRSRYGVLALFMTVTIVLAYFAPRVDLERDSSKLTPQDTPAMQLQRRILAEFRMTLDPSIFFAPDLVEVERIRQAALRASTLAEPLAVTAAIPGEQAAKRPMLSTIGDRLDAMVAQPRRASPDYGAEDLEELATRLARLKRTSLELSLLARLLYGEQTQAVVGEIRDHLNRIAARVNAASVDRLRYLDRLVLAEIDAAMEIFTAMTRNQSVTVDDLPVELVERLRGKDGSWMVLAAANGDPFEQSFLDAHIDELYSISPEVTGLIPVWKRMLDKILADLPVLMGATLLAVAFFVLLGLRSLRGMVLALAPLLVGMVWTIGLLGLAGMNFNVVSVLAVPLIVGIGIDNGVHLYHRIRHDGSVAAALAHTGKPVLLTSLTTGIGFGSLLLSVHRGVFYLGLTTALGILCCLVVTLLLLPALVAIFDEGILRDEPSHEEDAA